MDLHKLKAFTVVAEELNFRKSAEILGMSGPPLTRLIASLEKELGTRLFERTTRNVSLTGAGILLLKEAREIAAAFERIETEVRAVGKLKSGLIRIGFSRTAFVTRFPTLIEEFQARFPKIKVELLEDSAQEVVRHLKDGRIDVAFSEVSLQTETMQSHRFSSESVGALLPQKHPLAKKKGIQFRELANETFIVHSRREATEFFDRISHLQTAESKKPLVYVKNPNESCPILVATGKGVSLTVNGGWSAIMDRVHLVPITDMTLPIYMVWNSESPTSPLKSFLSLIMEKQNVLPHRAECLVLSNESIKRPNNRDLPRARAKR